MQHTFLYRTFALLVMFITCVLADMNGQFQILDHYIGAKRMALSHRPASGEIVLLEIDNKSLTAIGVWPWKRSIYGQVIGKAFDAGAEEIAFDIDFSSSSSAKEDLAFQTALENAPGPVTLAIFQQHDISDLSKASVQTNRPITQLEESAWLATVNVLADGDGMVRRFPYAQEIEGEYFPSLTSVLGGVQALRSDTFIIDYGTDIGTIPTYPIIDLLENKLPPQALQGKKVLIGAGAAELRDSLAVPVYGVLSGPKLQILAAENLVEDRDLAFAPAPWHYLLFALLCIPILLLAINQRRGTLVKLASLIGLSLLVEAIGTWVYFKHPLLLQTGMLQTQLVSAGGIMILVEIRLKDLLLTLSRRHSESLSALLQTIVEDSFSGILIIGKNGYIVEISQQAKSVFAELGYRTRRGDNIAGTIPPELVELLHFRLRNPTRLNDDQKLDMLTINHNGQDLYFEYSITPSLISHTQEEQEDEEWVVTLLFHDVTEARREQLRLEYLADHDSLTGLFNTKGFCEKIEEHVTSSEQMKALIIACQATRIEKITHSLGPDYADLLMQRIANRLERLSIFDLAGCTEQEEFLLYKIDADKQDIPALVEQIEACLHAPFSIRGHDIIIGTHIGIAAFEKSDQPATEIVKAASVTLHHCKEKGDNYLFYTSNLAADVVNRRELEHDVIGALQRGEFELFYQPQVDLKTRKTTGCEALIRWKHRKLGYVRPDRFIPILEETGMITELGRWILNTACKEAMKWPEPVTVAVNISAVQFARSDILADIDKALRQSRLPKERLHIEITESLFIADPKAVIYKLNAIRENGIKIALDDFGTGYSSLSYIHQFPLDKIKIDRAFVKDLPHSLDSMAVITAVVALAHGFDMDIVAEGIETAAQAELLQHAGCHIGQGYFFGKPLAYEDFYAYLSAGQKEEKAIASTRMVG